MSVDEWADMMGDTITIENRVGYNGYGAAVYGDPVEYRCHVRNVVSTVHKGDGLEVVSRRRIILGTLLEALSYDARVTLTSGGQPRQVLDVMQIDVASDPDGPHHTVLYV